MILNKAQKIKRIDLKTDDANFLIFEDWKEAFEKRFEKVPSLFDTIAFDKKQQNHELLIVNSVARINAANQEIDNVLNNPELCHEEVMKIISLVENDTN